MISVSGLVDSQFSLETFFLSLSCFRFSIAVVVVVAIFLSIIVVAVVGDIVAITRLPCC